VKSLPALATSCNTLIVSFNCPARVRTRALNRHRTYQSPDSGRASSSKRPPREIRRCHNRVFRIAGKSGASAAIRPVTMMRSPCFGGSRPVNSLHKSGTGSIFPRNYQGALIAQTAHCHCRSEKMCLSLFLTHERLHSEGILKLCEAQAFRPDDSRFLNQNVGAKEIWKASARTILSMNSHFESN